MKLQILSDLHIDRNPKYGINDIDSDLIIVAGDVSSHPEMTINYLNDQSVKLQKDILFVPGNHDFNGASVQSGLDMFNNKAIDSVRVLYNQDITIEGVHFIGSTLWTDFRLFGDAGEWFAKNTCKTFSDFTDIHEFSIETCVNEYRKSYNYLSNTIKNDSVVITHFCPSLECGKKSPFPVNSGSAYFYSQSEHLIKNKLWIFGHNHIKDEFDFFDTKMISNPVGYNSIKFFKDVIIEI
jgi:Icc-related predicted phosphoesterase